MRQSKYSSALAHTLSLVLLTTFVHLARAQQITANEYVPVDGDTLSFEERNHHRLLKNVDGFQYAVFSRSEVDCFDSRVFVMIGDTRKELVVQKCRSLSDWEDAVENMYKRTVKDELERRDEELNRTGADVTVTLDDSTIISGELLFVDDSITVCSESQIIQVVACENVQTVVVHGESRLGKAAAIGVGTGVFVGGAFALASAGDDRNRDALTHELSKGIRALLIGGGAVAGFALGFVVGLASSEGDRELEVLTPQNVMVLKSLARYSTNHLRAAETNP